MAFQIQYPPQTPNPFQSFMGGWNAMSESQVRGLEKQLLKRDIDAYDQRLNAELGQMLAATEASQASTDLSQIKMAGEEFQNLLAQQYGEQQLLNEMAYKNAIGSSAMSNAEIAGINAALAQAQLPGNLAQIEATNRKIQLDNIMTAAVMQSLMTGKPIEEILAGTGFGGVSGGKQTSIGQSNKTAAPSRIGPSNNMMDYATPAPAESIDLVGNTLNRFKTPQQIEGEKAESSAEGSQKVKNYYALEKEAGMAAQDSFNENAMINQLINTHGDIPWWNKEALGGLLPPIAQKSKLFESLLSGNTLSVLGEQKGVASDFDAQMIREIFGSRTFDEINLKELLLFKEIQNDRKVEFQKFVANNSGKSRGQIERDWNDYMQDNSLFDSEKWQNHLLKRREMMSPSDAALDELKERERKEEHEKLMDQKYGRTSQ